MNHPLTTCLLLVLAFQVGPVGGPPSANRDDRPAHAGNVQAPPGDASLYRSEGGGATWKPLGLGSLGVSALAIDPSDPSTLYAGTEASGVFKSTDGGQTWSPRSAGLRSLSINALGINRSRPSM